MKDTIQHKEDSWDIVITPRKHLLQLDLREVWRYRDLLVLFVRRNIVAEYKQTILGPLWYVIQPLLTTIMFTIIFGNLAGISTDGVPPMLFYLAGITNWNYFAECLNKTATTFKDNQNLFGKVWFPRLVVPLSVVITSILKYLIQLLLFLGFYGYFLVRGAPIQANAMALLFPVLLLILAGLGLGFGLVFTSLTTKYRDLVFLLTFGVQLAMYATPVIYPLSEVPADYHWLAVLNPMTAVIETFKYGFLGHGTFSWVNLGYSLGFMVGLLFISIAVFNRTEKNFMDTV
ncbi:MAG: ABC transporter permease [Saprospiraceae bacterium]